MEQSVGIVAEFNPFHNGHGALVRMAREAGARYVTAVMSGNFVQRGEPACAEKRVRTGAALACGVDLVLELPVIYAAAPAQRFARGAVGLLQAVGCVDTLCFGSECGSAAELQALARSLEDPALNRELHRHLDQGLTFARARQLAAQELLGPGLSDLLARPNNALAVEYLRQAARLGWNPRILTFPRQGADHDGTRPVGEFASASFLRGRLTAPQELGRYMPPEALAVYRKAGEQGLFPASPQRLETAVLSHLRRLSPERLSRLPDLSEGLEHRLYGGIRRAASLAELEGLLKTKRYTLARIRRLLLSAFLDLTREDCALPPPYLRVLGFTDRGKDLVSRMKQTAALPVHVSLARLRERGGGCARLAALEERATDLYALCLPRPMPCGYEYSASAVFPDKPPST